MFFLLIVGNLNYMHWPSVVDGHRGDRTEHGVDSLEKTEHSEGGAEWVKAISIYHHVNLTLLVD